MKIHFLFILQLIVLLPVTKIFSQKPAIDLATSKGWTELNKYDISNDGKYIWYNYFSGQNSSTLVLKSIDGKWQQIFENATRGYFTEDGKYFIIYANLVLKIVRLSDKKAINIDGVQDVRIPRSVSRWVFYTDSQGLVAFDIKTLNNRSYGKVIDYQFDSKGKYLMINTGSILALTTLQTGANKILTRKAEGVRHLCFDAQAKRACFLRRVGLEVSLFYYEAGMDTAEVVLSNEQLSAYHCVKISYDEKPEFSSDGRRIFLGLEKTKRKLNYTSSIITSKVNVWSYKDRYLQPYQEYLYNDENTRHLKGVFNVNENRFIQLENADSSIVGALGNNYVVIKKISNEQEFYWAPEEFPGAHIVRLSDGARYECANINNRSFNFFLSPSEQFLVSYDTLSKHCYSYEIATGLLRNITGTLRVPQAVYENGRIKSSQYEIEGWIGNSERIIIYDEYDVWEIDVSGKKPPVALTGRYGRRKRIAFRLATSQQTLSSLNENSYIVLAALADSNKHNGLVKIKLGRENNLNMLKLEPYLYYFPGIFVPNAPEPLIKARDADVYLLQKQSDTIASNVVTTNDFRKYVEQSFLAPQSQWNWLRADLVHWKAYDDNQRSGVLYKPENFDPKVKYPIIFNYYELRSNERFRFLSPSLSIGDLNIPWYVSNGYLVFVPDIHKHTGYTGQTVLNSVLSAVDHLGAKYSWIDTTKMGLQGHSFGGYETNYIVTHSTRFAAAQSSAGPSDFVSSYGGLGLGRESLANITEVGQNDMGCTPWDQPLLYIQNSPIFFVNKVTTPLLLMHNTNDGVVPMSQSIELFTALRRLGRPVWLLEYTNKGHILDINEPESLDFTIRQRQFFDYYLKEAGGPEWMTKGIPFPLKGVVSGLGLDSIDRRP